MKKELIGILICTLLLSVAVSPVINALTIKKNEINIAKEPTFSLQDTNAWEETINDIITRFQDAETQESKIAILKEIPIVMDIYGLLPEDMTVKEAQKLIISSYLETIASSSLQSDKQSKVAGDSPLVVSKNVFHSILSLFQVLGSNLIIKNNFRLDPPQPAPWPPDDKTVFMGFGRISNPKRHTADDGYYWSFNCENVIFCHFDDENFWCYWHHFTNGEEAYMKGDPWKITDKFMYQKFFIFFLIT